MEKIGVSVTKRNGTLRVNILVPDRFTGQPSGEVEFPGIETIRDYAFIAGGKLEFNPSSGRESRVICTLPV